MRQETDDGDKISFWSHGDEDRTRRKRCQQSTGGWVDCGTRRGWNEGPGQKAGGNTAAARRKTGRKAPGIYEAFLLGYCQTSLLDQQQRERMLNLHMTNQQVHM